jgi:radical SAM superfamily enzyme YgiQ (UPF0313 family)
LRVLLSSPPFQYFNTSHWLLPNFPAITLAQLAGGLDPRHEVRILDNSHHKLRGHVLWPTIEDFQPDLIGFTCMYAPDAPVLWDLAQRIKERWPQVKIVGGGSVATHVAELFVQNGFDAILKNEGDFAIQEIVDAIAGRRRLVPHRRADLEGPSRGARRQRAARAHRGPRQRALSST